MDFDPTGRDPFEVFDEWYADAKSSEPNDPNAMCLSTVNASACPSSRMVLLKNYGADGFTFFTNSESRKGQELSDNPNVALLFHWKSLLRQIRIEGRAGVISRAETEGYFHSRARESQIASYASDQSQPLPDKAVYMDRINEVRQQFDGQHDIPCPDHWNGYRVIPSKIEFWIQKDYRTHDRFVFTREQEGGNWHCQRLYP